MKKYVIMLAIIVVALGVAGCKQEVPPPAPQQQPAPQATPQPTGPPTYVAEGKTPEDHVNDFYKAYKEGRLEDAFELAPAVVKAKQPKDQFVSARKTMPISEFKVGDVKEDGANKETIAVEYNIGQYGTWVSTWEFEKKDGKWIAVNYLAGQK